MDNVNLLESLYDAFGRGDIPTILGAMSPDINWHPAESHPFMPSGEAWVGPDAVLNNLFVKLGAEWDGFSIHAKAFHDAGDSVIVEAPLQRDVQGDREEHGHAGLPHLGR